MKCIGCSQDRKLVKAHIIPESFFRGLRDGQTSPKVFSNVDSEYPKKSPIGIYDTTILCFDCEQKFDSTDTYGSEILLNKESQHQEIVSGICKYGYVFRPVDHAKLKLFFMSVLWRASVSKQPFYSKVKLGPLENSLKEYVWNQDPGGDHDFSYVLFKFEPSIASRSILDPHPEKFFGVRYYRFYLYGYTLIIKVDSQKTPTQWAEFIPSDDSLTIVYRGHIENKKEYPLMVSTYNKNNIIKP